MKMKHLFSGLCLLLAACAAQASVITSYARGAISEGSIGGGLFGAAPVLSKLYEITVEFDITSTLNTLTGNYVNASGSAPAKVTLTIGGLTQVFSFQTTSESGWSEATLLRQPSYYDALNMGLLSADRSMFARTTMIAMSDVFGPAGPQLTAFYEHTPNPGDGAVMIFSISKDLFIGNVTGTVDYFSWNSTTEVEAPASVPEPLTPALFAIGLAGAAVLRRRR